MVAKNAADDSAICNQRPCYFHGRAIGRRFDSQGQLRDSSAMRIGRRKRRATANDFRCVQLSSARMPRHQQLLNLGCLRRALRDLPNSKREFVAA